MDHAQWGKQKKQQFLREELQKQTNPFMWLQKPPCWLFHRFLSASKHAGKCRQKMGSITTQQGGLKTTGHAADGRNPAPPGIYKTPVNNGINNQPQLVSRISEPSTVLQNIQCNFGTSSLPALKSQADWKTLSTKSLKKK